MIPDAMGKGIVRWVVWWLGRGRRRAPKRACVLNCGDGTWQWVWTWMCGVDVGGRGERGWEESYSLI